MNTCKTKNCVKENLCGVYLIRNTENGKVYIGSSVEMRKRWTAHVNLLKSNTHSNTHLQNAWNKDGEDAFEFTVIEECPESVLIAREVAWVEYHDSMNDAKGYNLEYPDRRFHTEETKKRISEAHKNNLKCQGHKHTEEVKRRISEAHKGNQYNKGRRGHHHSDETKRKIGEKHKGKNLSVEHKMKLSVAHKGKTPSAETRKLLSERTRAYWQRRNKEEVVNL